MPRSNEPVLFETKGFFAIVTLNRPAAYNAMSYEDWLRLAEVMKAIDARPDIRVTIITGAGSFFSAGANVKTRGGDANQGGANESERLPAMRRLSSQNMDLARTFYQHSKILVAALNGPAIGLAAALLGLCDFIYVVENAYIFTPFSALSIVAEAASSLTFAQRMGVKAAKEALVLGKKFGAAELLANGFVNKVFPAEPQPGFTSTILSYLKDKFSGLDIDAAVASRNLIRTSLASQYDAANVREIFAGVDAFGTGKPQQAFADFAAKKRRHKL